MLMILNVQKHMLSHSLHQHLLVSLMLFCADILPVPRFWRGFALAQSCLNLCGLHTCLARFLRITAQFINHRQYINMYVADFTARLLWIVYVIFRQFLQTFSFFAPIDFQILYMVDKYHFRIYYLHS